MTRTPAFADCHSQRMGFNRIADGSTGTVSFNIVNIVRLYIGTGINLFEQRALRR